MCICETPNMLLSFASISFIYCYLYINQYINGTIYHPIKEIKPKRIKENQSREVCVKTKEKILDHNHKYRNIVNKKAVTIIGDSILNGIDQHGFSNESFKVRVKNHPVATT